MANGGSMQLAKHKRTTEGRKTMALTHSMPLHLRREPRQLEASFSRRDWQLKLNLLLNRRSSPSS